METNKDHATLASEFLKDEQRADWHDETLWLIRSKRDKTAHDIPEWEQLREWASQVKEHTLSNLDVYLLQFEEKLIANGVNVHWAADAEEHNRIIHQILKKKKISQVVKSKSMLTEECGLNDYLINNGVQVVDTDLGEYIVQLRKEHPSHIVLPAIHLKKEDVSNTFHHSLNTEEGNNNPSYLALAARRTLREKFIQSEVAISGVNFAIAETGGIVICTNEGNADVGIHNAPIHIACMGIEKIIPRTEHLGIFLRLLARSATGQAITAYSSHYYQPQPGQEMHVVIVDNGRSRQLARPDFRNSLKCIRCAACFNTCPVYRRSGGYSYHATIAGPIGAILNPNLNMKANADLPFASTLCGSCSYVCPVKINIHEQLWKWRQVIAREKQVSPGKRLLNKTLSLLFSYPKLYRLCGKAGRWVLNKLPFIANNRLNPWYKQREMPQNKDNSFRDWYAKNRR